MKKILIVIGTRPELIKVACIVKEMERRKLRDHYLLINTAQHKDLLDPYWEMFGLKPDISLDVMRDNQSLSSLTTRVIDQFQIFLESITEEVSAILAQGDTTTVLGVSIVAFYNRIDFLHLEAGLRSFDLDNPYPEEFNRRVASITARTHFCPTEQSRNNLLAEGITDEKIRVVGNTVIDTVEIMRDLMNEHSTFENEFLNEQIKGKKQIVFITCHRRENHGKNLNSIIEAITELSKENKEMAFLWILHPNPNVKNTVLMSGLQSIQNVILIDPVSYPDLILLLSKSRIAISDSGGIQEEAPSFNVPVLVLRETTERPEGVAIGAAALVGSEKNAIKTQFYHYLYNPIDIKENPYGDGKSAARVVDVIVSNLIESQ